MGNPIIQALEITGIGMGLVFVGILVLWGLMALMVRVFREKESEPEACESMVEVPPLELKKKAAAAAVAVALNTMDYRRQAAAAAVAAALEIFGQPVMEPPAPVASSWQIVNRLNQINLRNQSYTRKSRGN